MERRDGEKDRKEMGMERERMEGRDTQRERSEEEGLEGEREEGRRGREREKSETQINKKENANLECRDQ